MKPRQQKNKKELTNLQNTNNILTEGSAIPWRARARSSCFCNLSVTAELCRGCLIADVPAVVGSLDIVLGEIDR
jgi:NADH-quinone oxidoreductase subunit D